MTAPAYIANVLNVDIRVCAPEKSIVPWAWATALLATMKSRAVSVGPVTRAASRRFRLENGCANRLERGIVLREMTAMLRNIGTSIGQSSAEICREISASPRSESNNLLAVRYNFPGAVSGSAAVQSATFSNGGGFGGSN